MLSRTITHSRMPSPPSTATCLNMSIVAKFEPASWNVVTPFSSAACTGELDLPARIGVAFRGRLLRAPRVERAAGDARRGFAQQPDRPAGRVLQDLAARRIRASSA